jgi:hypothetical protein
MFEYFNDIKILMNNLYYKKPLSINNYNYKFLKYIPDNYITGFSFFYYNNITDDDIKYYKDIEYLNISYCHNLTDESIKYMDKLSFLNMTNNYNITDDAFYNKHLLKKLRISQTNITSKILNTCINIEYLDISNSNFIINTDQYHLLSKLKTLNIKDTNNKLNDIFFEYCKNVEIIM